MNLYLFPSVASLQNGYSIAVLAAYNRLKPNKEDIVVWYNDINANEIPFIKDNDIVIKQPAIHSLKSIFKIMTNRYHHEVDYKSLLELKKYDFDTIHCDEVIFYRAMRKLYPNKKISVRFHNVFARIRERERVLSVKQDLRFEKKMKILAELEFEIFNDKNVYKIFLSNEDKYYYTSMTGKTVDSEVWHIQPEINISLPHKFKLSNKLVWFGGIEGHKTSSVKWFIKEVFPKVKEKIPDVEFHLWGRHTEQFNDTNKNIFGHGRYLSEDLPMKDEALFINPDVIGGGVKIKLITYFKENVPFISTPFGFEGYKDNLKNINNCYITEMDMWAEKIISILTNK